MRVLIEPSGYKLGNIGDAAMLLASVERLRRLWPEAELAAVTRAPEALQSLCPGVEPLEAGARSQFLQLARSIPLPLLLEQADDFPASVQRFAVAFQQADLLLVSGAGGFTDAFRDQALTTLDLLDVAQCNGKPTVLVGQGLGPWEDPQLSARAREILPRASALFLRERRLAESLLRDIPADLGGRLRVTGDDALEMVYSARPDELGASIGVNLRLAAYSAVSDEAVEQVRTALRELSEGLQAPFLPAPVSHPPNSSDPAAIAALIGGDGGASLTTPARLIEQIGRCRLVVTGSYHAAVFALAQGIPAIGMVASPYYEGKFKGLADLFGPSCVPLEVQQAGLLPEIGVELWERAAERRAALLDETRRQIEEGRAAYQAIPALIARPEPAAQSKPRVSVVVPVFNQADLLRTCLESIRRQTLPDWEAIVVDDCSSQGDPAAVVAALEDPRIRWLRHERNRGLAAARNTGFRDARTDWVLPLDADDLLEPVCLEALIERSAQEPAAGAVFGRLRYFGGRTGVWRTEAQDVEAFLRRKRMPGAGVLWRKALWEAAGGYCEDEILRGGQEDTEFWLAAFEAGAQTACEPRPVYWYRRHDLSMTGTIPDNYHRIREFLYRRRRSVIDRHGRPGQFLADGYWRSALSRFRAGRRAAAMLFVGRAVWAAREARMEIPNAAELQAALARGTWYYPAYQQSPATLE